jgi:phage antirepressor YoqD-like protein
VVELDGQSYDLTPYESKILRLLHKAHLEKRGSVGIGEICAALEIKSGKMSDWFRKTKPLKKIILHTGRQHYRLDL